MQPQDYKSRTRNVRREARAHLIALRRARTSQRTATARQDTGSDRAELPSDRELHAHTVAFVHHTTSHDAAALPERPAQDTEMRDDAEVSQAAMADLVDDNIGASDPAEAPSVEAVTETPTDLDACPPMVEESHQTADAGDDAVMAANEIELTSDVPPVEDAFIDVLQTEYAPKQEVAAQTQPAPETKDLAPPATESDVIPETVAPDECETDRPETDLKQLPGAGPGLIWMLNQCGIQSLHDLALQDPDALSERLGVVGQILDVGQWITLAQDMHDNSDQQALE